MQSCSMFIDTYLEYCGTCINIINLPLYFILRKKIFGIETRNFTRV